MTAGHVTAGSEIQFSGIQLAQRYTITDEIAPGALCRILRGEDLTLRRPVVVKAIPPDQVEVYTAALQASSALTHPAAVAFYDAIHEDGWLFLVQEAIQGSALSRYLRQGVPGERAVNLALQLARALAYSHHRDIIHGDLTPAAVLIDRHAVVRVNNFGLPPDLDYFRAEGGDDVLALIVEGSQHGDVLAFGLLLRQLLSTAELGGTEPGARQVRDDVPPELAQLITRCTAPATSDAITDAISLTIALEEMAELLASARESSRTDTPAGLRAAHAATADQALWSSEQTVANAPVPQYTLERGSHEVGSHFTFVTNHGHSDGASTRPSDEADLAVPPRLRLPTRPLPEPEVFQANARRPAPRYHAGYADDHKGARGMMLGGILLVGMALFIIFFLIGFLGPFSLGGR